MYKLTIMAASLPSTPPLEYVEAAAAAGYDGVGLRLHKSPSFPNWHDWLDDEPLKREVRRAIGGSGQEMNEILSYYITPEVDVASMAPSLEYGATLGASYAWVAGRDEDFNRQADSVGRFCDAAAQFGITALLGGPIGTFDPISNAFKTAEACGRPNVAVCVGVGLALRAPATVGELAGRRRDLVPLVHMNNGTPAEKVAELLDVVSNDIVLSVEWPAPRGSQHTAPEWARTTMTGVKAFLRGYYGEPR
ncbi:MAG: hypothetical protein JO247_01450 [Chloroflexi bacterium]|nr:hypothetical protein [Chloroflexota bacterium]